MMRLCRTPQARASEAAPWTEHRPGNREGTCTERSAFEFQTEAGTETRPLCPVGMMVGLLPALCVLLLHLLYPSRESKTTCVLMGCQNYPLFFLLTTSFLLGSRNERNVLSLILRW